MDVLESSWKLLNQIYLMTDVSISICIPTFNRFFHLKETLKNISRLSLKYEFIKEIVILDNNENSKATSLVAPLLKKFEKIRYIKNDKNIGSEENFKKCILSAKSEFVWLIADDDLLFEVALETISKRINQKFDCLLVNWSLYDNDINDLLIDSVLPKNIKFYSDKNFILENFGSKLSFISSVIFKKNLFNNHAIAIYDKFAPHQLSFLIFIYYLASSNKIDFIYEKRPLIKQRGENDPFLGKNVTNFYRVFSEGIASFHQELAVMSYQQKSINRSFKESFKRFIFKDLLSRKIENNNFKFAFQSSLKNYGHFFDLRMLILLTSIIPSSLLSLLRTIKNLLK